MATTFASMMEILTINVSGQEFGLAVGSVREIRGWTTVTPLPHAPNYVAGVINLRGAVLPIVDLACRLGFKPTVPTERQVIVVVEMGERLVGLLVDGVTDIVTFDAKHVHPTPEIMSDKSTAFIHGVALLEGRMIELIVLEKTIPVSDGTSDRSDALELAS
jgi:purine-binding chemotaxis protein CheW